MGQVRLGWMDASGAVVGGKDRELEGSAFILRILSLSLPSKKGSACAFHRKNVEEMCVGRIDIMKG